MPDAGLAGGQPLSRGWRCRIPMSPARGSTNARRCAGGAGLAAEARPMPAGRIDPGLHRPRRSAGPGGGAGGAGRSDDREAADDVWPDFSAWRAMSIAAGRSVGAGKGQMDGEGHGARLPDGTLFDQRIVNFTYKALNHGVGRGFRAGMELRDLGLPGLRGGPGGERARWRGARRATSGTRRIMLSLPLGALRGLHLDGRGGAGPGCRVSARRG